MTEKIKIALCGCLGHVEKFGRLINSFEESEVAAVWDDDMSRGQSVADNLGCPFEPDYDRLLSDYGLDGVVITSYNALHKEMVIKAAKSGKHIFLEKPLCVDPGDAREMQLAVHTAGIKFYMSDPFVHAGVIFLKKMIKEGKLGAICMARFRFGGNAVLSSREDYPIYDKTRTQGGIMADVGGHMIHIAHYLFGKPSEISAVAACCSEPAKEKGIEENAVVVMKYPDSKLVTLECSWMDGAGVNSTEVFGTKGYAKVDRNGLDGKTDIVSCRIGKEAPAEIPGSSLPSNPMQHIRYFVEMILKDIPNEAVGVDDMSNNGVIIDDAVDYVDIIDAVYQSVKQGGIRL